MPSLSHRTYAITIQRTRALSFSEAPWPVSVRLSCGQVKAPSSCRIRRKRRRANTLLSPGPSLTWVQSLALWCVISNSDFVMRKLITHKIPLGQTINGSGSSVGDGTYIAFTILMLAGSILGFSLIKTGKVIREDGSKVITMQHPSWKSELLGLWQVLRRDYFIILLFPVR